MRYWWILPLLMLAGCQTQAPVDYARQPVAELVDGRVRMLITTGELQHVLVKHNLERRQTYAEWRKLQNAMDSVLTTVMAAKVGQEEAAKLVRQLPQHPHVPVDSGTVANLYIDPTSDPVGLLYEVKVPTNLEHQYEGYSSQIALIRRQDKFYLKPLVEARQAQVQR